MRAEFRIESWPLHQPFVTSREVTELLAVLHCELKRGLCIGHSEALGVDYHGETPASVQRTLEVAVASEDFRWDRMALLDRLPAGGARNALDCALWDLEAKAQGRRVWELAGLAAPCARQTTYTIGLAEPSRMAADFALAPPGAVLKLKLGARDGRDVDRVSAVRQVAPDAEIVVDVNEGWSIEELNEAARAMKPLGVRLIEQPLPAAQDHALDGYSGSLPLCADESFMDHSSFDSLHPRYSCINIKLDKTGGLTEALGCATTARVKGLTLFVGNMLGTSLAMAPAFVLAQQCRWVDLDGPLLLARDREPAITYDGAMMQPFGPEVWG